MSNIIYHDTVAVGIIQTTLNATLAWPKGAQSPRMSSTQDEHVWLELCKAVRTFQDSESKPRIIVIPELSLPRTRLTEFRHLVGTLNVIAIAGVDYNLNWNNNTAKNQGIIFVPNNFFKDRPSHYCTSIAFGKTYAAPGEKKKLKEIYWEFKGDDNVYVIDCQMYGRIGLSICYDLMDIERALMYRGRIQHLFVLAYNRDLNSFRSLSESLSRTIYCNVLICNTGFFGGSIAVSPFYESFKRILYAHSGQNLFTTQIVHLSVKGIIEAQKGNIKVQGNPEWKSLPPGL